MKKLFFAIIVLISMTATKGQSISKNWNGNSINFEITKMIIDPYGLKTFEVSITSTKNIDVELIFSSAPYAGDVLLSGQYTKEQVFVNVIAGQVNKFVCNQKIVFQGSEKALVQIGARWDNGTQGENLFVEQKFVIPIIRPLVVLSTTSVTSSQIVVSSNITTSNLDDVASFEVTDANGKSLLRVIETIGSTVSPVTFSKSITIDLNLYPTASTLTTTSSTGGSQKLKLKSASSGISNLVSNGVLTDEKIITIFYSNGASTKTTWGEGKYLTNRISTIQVDNEIVRDIPIFIR